ncbi:MAG: DUF11 domain-containing protein [Anaerolineae bacterium]|nr:DUF11 domain-containing protein [Anaerolineae bacterium]
MCTRIGQFRSLISLFALFSVIVILVPSSAVYAAAVVVDNAGTVGLHTSLVLNGSNPVISYYDSNTADLKIAVCNNPACDLAVIIRTVDAPWSVGQFTSLALNGGNPVVSYYDVTNTSLKVLACNDPTCDPAVNGPESILTVDGAGMGVPDVGRYTSMKLNGGNPVIAYRDDTNTSLKIMVCNDPACDPAVNGPEIVRTIDGTAVGDNVGRFPSLVLNGGNPVIGYRDDGNTSLKIMVCNDPACDPAVNGPEIIRTIDGAGAGLPDVGIYTSLALIGGNPVISYHDSGNLDLKIVVCNDPTCDPAVNGPEIIRTIDATGTVGLYNSLVLDGSNPVISYYDTTNGDLKIVACNDPTCDPAVNGAENIQTVDAAGNVGGYTSIKLNAGSPVVSYWDVLNNYLKVYTPSEDWGDAPDSYNTILTSNGPRHTAGTLFMGGSIDVEIGGLPSANATGDDTNGIDDENGVTFTTSPLISGNPAIVTVNASGAGLLDAWIDFNRDGDFADAGEQIFASQSLVAGNNALTYAVPAGAVPGSPAYARFRISNAGGLSYNGASPDGEVEDHWVAISSGTDLRATKTSNAAGVVTPGGTFNWTITIANIGANDGTFNIGDVILTDDLPVAATYGAPVVQNDVNITNPGNINCTLVGTLLNCDANGGNVIVGATTGSFEVVIPVTAPTTTTVLHNPEAAGICQVDPADNIIENSETNNDCVNTVNVGILAEESGETSGSTGQSGDILHFDPAISKIGVLQPGQLGLVGEQIEWVVTVSNNGSASGINVIITDTLRSELRVDRVSSNVISSISGQTVTVTIPVLNPGQSVTFSIYTTVLASDVTVDNTVCLVADNRNDPVCNTAPSINLPLVRELPSTGETPWWAQWLWRSRQ